MNFEHEFRDLNQYVRHGYLVEVCEDPVLYNVFSFKSLVEKLGVTQGQVGNLNFSQNIVIGKFKKVLEGLNVFNESVALEVACICLYSIEKSGCKCSGRSYACCPEILRHYCRCRPVLRAYVKKTVVFQRLARRMVIDHRSIIDLGEQFVMRRLGVYQDELLKSRGVALFKRDRLSRSNLTIAILFNLLMGLTIPIEVEATLRQSSLFTARAEPMASGSGSIVTSTRSLEVKRA